MDSKSRGPLRGAPGAFHQVGIFIIRYYETGEKQKPYHTRNKK